MPDQPQPDRSDLETAKAIGHLQGVTSALRRDLDNISIDLHAMRADVTAIKSSVDQAKGSWKVLMALSTLAAGGGAGVTVMFQWMANLFTK